MHSGNGVQEIRRTDFLFTKLGLWKKHWKAVSMSNPQLQIRLVDPRNLRSKKLFKTRNNLSIKIRLLLKELHVVTRGPNKLQNTFLKIVQTF